MERRKKSRQPAFLGGTILYNRRLWSAACVVKNQTDCGARLLARDFSAIPDEFELAIPRHEGAYQAKVQWRKRNELGVTIAPLQSADLRALGSRPKRLSALVLEDDVEAVRRSLIHSIE
jgi:hypothetical protein